MNYKLFIFSIFLFITQLSFAQLRENERLVYAGSYNMSGLMTQLAQITLTTKKASTAKSTFIHVKMEASTFSKWDSYFKIRDSYESYLSPATLKPSLYKRSVNEGRYHKTEKYTYQSDGKTIKSTSQRRDLPPADKTFTVKEGSVDIIAALYKLRTIDFSNYKIGQTFPFSIVFDEKEFPATIKLMGKETINAGKLGKKECYKLSIGAKTDVLRGTDKNLVWITTDSDRIPALLQFSIPVGTGQLTLTDVQ